MSNIPENYELPESPASANIKVWIDGYGVMFTTRATTTNEVVKNISALVEVAKTRNWQPTWEQEDKTIPYNKTSQTVKEFDDKQIKQQECEHKHISTLQSTGHSKPENKGRYYKTCTDCKKFLGWEE